MWNPTHASGAGGGGGGVTDHGALTGLLDDDHTQYALWAAIQAAQLCNEVMNHPSLEGADNALPEWWENGANSALTEVDIAGEAGITETWERGFKVATTAVAAYSYQRYTYADQPRIKSGRALSAIFAVWSVGGIAARIRLITSAGTTVVSANTTAAGWTILTAQNLTLDGTYVDIRMEADSGTAYFVPLGINVGAKAIPVKPRGLRYRESAKTATIETLDGANATQNWADLDLTADTGNLAAKLHLFLFLDEEVSFWGYQARRNGDARTGDELLRGRVMASGREQQNDFDLICDDAQIIERKLTLIGGSNAINTCQLYLRGWYEWE